MASITPVKLQSSRDFQFKRPLLLRRRLQHKLALRLLAICFFGCLTGFLVFNTPYWMAGIWTALITAGLFVNTIQVVASSERKLTAFLQALRQGDFAVTFAEDKNAEEYDLHGAFNQLNDIFKNLRRERESHHQLLQVVVENVNTPLICFDETTSEVYLINNAATQLLKIPFLQKLDSLSRVDFELLRLIKEIRDGEKRSHKLSGLGKLISLTVTSSHVLFEERNLKLITMQDVTSELAVKEAETWHSLLRVLTHEISNSAIPLSTLASHIYEMVIKSREESRELTSEQRDDIMTSLKTIDQRSRTLKEFVQNFRLVGQVPEPRIERVSADELVSDGVNLFTKDFEKESIHLRVSLPANVFIYADRNLTQQVFINLFKNAIEAMSNMKDGKYIDVRVEHEGHRYVHIIVQDSGGGISAEHLDQIFIPFFSTKKGGSGIGLSISKQIMQKQRGEISVQSQPGFGTRFTVSFETATARVSG